MDKEREKKLALSFIPSVTAEDLKRIWNTDISWESIEIFLGKERLEWFMDDLKWADDDSIGEHGFIFYGDDDYPENLKNDPQAPFRIAYYGSKPMGNNGTYNRAESITVVGTRRCTSEGIKNAFVFASEASNAGLVVYSGYADGIDKAAHYGAIAAGKPTFAVLPSGLSHEYSHRRARLEEYILSNGGGFISQFRCSEDPYKGNFYIRNRLLASLTDATVVIEAPKQSGSLITARAAVELGKSVFVNATNSKNFRVNEGCAELKNEGAIEINSYSSLSENHIEYPKGRVLVEIERDKVAEVKATKSADKILGYNGCYFAIV